MRDTIGVLGQCHQIKQGGGRESTKVSRDIFWTIISRFEMLFLKKNYIFQH